MSSSLQSSTSNFSSSRIAAARQTNYIAFLHRHPFATVAHDIGFVTGFREDQSLRTSDLSNVTTPVGMLDNHYKDPDLDRYIRRFKRHEPDIGVLGDAKTVDDAERYLDAVESLRTQYPETTYIIVPKSAVALERLRGEEVTLGYPNGYSDILAEDFSEPADWRGLDVHILGSSPPKQFEVIKAITRPTVSGAPPANIVGTDWNGILLGAYKGEYFSGDGWKPADHLSIQETVRRSLEEIKAFWQARGVWPTATPRDHHGRAVKIPDDRVWAATGEAVREQDTLENAIVVEYEDGTQLGYQSETERDWIEWRTGRHRDRA